MTVKLSPFGPKPSFSDSNGAPLVGGKLQFYAAGSTTPQNTYTDSTGGVANANPVVLNSRGEPTNEIWFTEGLTYKVVLLTSAGVTLWTVDNISAVNDFSSFDEWKNPGLTPTFVSGTSFTLSGDQTTEFHVGRRLKSTNTAGTIYSTISASSFAAGTTTITVTNDSGTLDSGLSAVSYGLIRATNPSITQLNGPLTVGVSSSGATTTSTLTNSSNTASSDAKQEISVGGSSAGDPYTRWLITGVKSWSMGVDNSDTDALVVSEDGVIGTGNRIKFNAGGLVDFPSGQIGFPATQNPSAGANVLDDYEEGTWTPNVGGSATYTSQDGTYTKIGRHVFFRARLIINAIGTGSTGVISGLPFTAAAVAAISVGYFTGSATNYVSLMGFVNSGATTINLTSLAAAAANVTNPATFFANGSDIMISGHYTV